jgi:hypothetical protein
MNYKLHPSVRFRKIDRRGVLVHQKNNEVIGINQSASFIIEQINEGQNLEQIAQMISERFKIEVSEAQLDAKSLCNELVQAQILQEV